MNPNTYDALPTDVRDDLPPAGVRLDRDMPDDVVDIFGPIGAKRMPVQAFVRVRRKLRKAERRNRALGRRR